MHEELTVATTAARLRLERDLAVPARRSLQSSARKPQHEPTRPARPDAEFYDCTIRAGYYNLSGVEVAQHTFAIAEKNQVKFALPCFGSFALADGERNNRGVVYPADMWTPWIVGSTNQGPAQLANLSVALGMAQFTLFPRIDWSVADWDTHWRLNPALNGYSVASWAGLIYGISGVCHQACNRVLWSTRKGVFDYAQVNWPPSLSASYWVYGFYGKAMDAAAILAAALVVKALLSSATSEEEALKSQQLVRDVMAHQIRLALSDPTAGAARGHEVLAMLDYVREELRVKDAKTLAEVVRLDGLFSNKKIAMDRNLYQSQSSGAHDGYAGTVNREFSLLLDSLRSVLPEDTFTALFPDAQTGKKYELVNRKLMPENYLRHREGRHD